mmetsp:Transcript_2689/g.6817  ORF Transcript_2689/g.6817 Transcript_2689/m.6817 type:complete len:507 (+) Transcript_2689:56-1576(+)
MPKLSGRRLRTNLPAFVAVACLVPRCLGQDCEAYAAAADAGPELKINHAQFVGTHNSYHVAEPALASAPTFNFTHAPFGEQLEAGVRGFELDLYYDITAGVFRVLHAPLIDQRSSCSLLSECLSIVRSWSDRHPSHYPILIYMEFKGFVRSGADATDKSNACLLSDLGPAIACIFTKCATASEAISCVFSNCVAQMGEASQKHPTCYECAQQAAMNSGPGTLALNHAVQHCMRLPSDQPQLDLDIVQKDAARLAAILETAAPVLDALLDSSFPASRRVSPQNLTGGLSGYANTGAANFWPEVRASRGTAMFWLDPAFAWPLDVQPTRPYFLDGVDNVMKNIAITSTTQESSLAQIVSEGVLLRAYFPGGGFSEGDAWRAGAHAPFTNHPPTLALAPGGPATWPGLAPGQHFWMGGTAAPVGCNPATVSGDLGCTAQLLEDPAHLQCGKVQIAPTASPTLAPSAPPTEEQTVAASQRQQVVVSGTIGITLRFVVVGMQAFSAIFWRA